MKNKQFSHHVRASMSKIHAHCQGQEELKNFALKTLSRTWYFYSKLNRSRIDTSRALKVSYLSSDDLTLSLDVFCCRGEQKDSLAIDYRHEESAQEVLASVLPSFLEWRKELGELEGLKTTELGELGKLEGLESGSEPEMDLMLAALEEKHVRLAGKALHRAVRRFNYRYMKGFAVSVAPDEKWEKLSNEPSVCDNEQRASDKAFLESLGVGEKGIDSARLRIKNLKAGCLEIIAGYERAKGERKKVAVEKAVRFYKGNAIALAGMMNRGITQAVRLGNLLVEVGDELVADNVRIALETLERI